MRTIADCYARIEKTLAKGMSRSDATWEEGKHPRSKDGKFGSGGGSSKSSSSKKETSVAPEAKSEISAKGARNIGGHITETKYLKDALEKSMNKDGSLTPAQAKDMKERCEYGAGLLYQGIEETIDMEVRKGAKENGSAIKELLAAQEILNKAEYTSDDFTKVIQHLKDSRIAKKEA